jgi:hypothetical protein
VDPAVLNAFINPSFKTNVTQINPQKRKIETSSETVKTLTPTSVPKNKKSKIGQKLKFEK